MTGRKVGIDKYNIKKYETSEQKKNVQSKPWKY